MSDHVRAQRGFHYSMGSALAGLSFNSHRLKREVCLRNTRAALRWKSALGPGLQGPAELNVQLRHTEQLQMRYPWPFPVLQRCGNPSVLAD